MQVSENSIFTCFVRFLGMGNKVHFESVRLYMAIVIEIEIALNNLFFQSKNTSDEDMKETFE